MVEEKFCPDCNRRLKFEIKDNYPCYYCKKCKSKTYIFKDESQNASPEYQRLEAKKEKVEDSKICLVIHYPESDLDEWIKLFEQIGSFSGVRIILKKKTRDQVLAIEQSAIELKKNLNKKDEILINGLNATKKNMLEPN